MAKPPYESPCLLLGERTAAPLDRPQHVAAVEELELQADLGGRAEHAEERCHVRVRGDLMQHLHLSTHHREHLGALAERVEAHHLERDAGAPAAPRGDVHLGRLALAQQAANIKGRRQAGGLLHSINAQQALRELLGEPLLAVQLTPQANHKGPRVLGGGLGRRTQHPKEEAVRSRAKASTTFPRRSIGTNCLPEQILAWGVKHMDGLANTEEGY